MRKCDLNLNKPFRTSTCFLILVFTFIKVSSQPYPIDSLMRNGDRNNRINLVYLSDGFKTNSELSNFVDKATILHTTMFSQAPFMQYKNYFNSYAIKVSSLQSGAKHPANAPDEPTGMAAQPQTNPENKFGSTFDYLGAYHRLLAPQNTSEIYTTLANHLPNYTQAFILVNSPYYGGSGGEFPTTSLDPGFAEIAIHEMGHSFAKLADEYWVSDVYAHEYPNMTSKNTATAVPWKDWLGKNGIGIYPYDGPDNASKWYRPHQNCKMQVLGNPFCSVCIETFINEIHDRTNMIDAITPVNTSFVLRNTNPVLFSITPIQPNPSTLQVKWYINNNPTPFFLDQTSVSVAFALFQMGANKVRAEVIDNTPLSKSYLPGVGYVNSIEWTVTVSAESLPVRLKSFSGKIKDDAAWITWDIDSPDDLQIFELEKSMDGLNFSRIASISGEQLRTKYNYADNRLYKPYTYYRLKTVEKDGSFHYSDIIRLQNSFDKFYYKVYQDAASHRYHLSVGITNKERVSFRITDVQGRVVKKKDFGTVDRQLGFDFDLAGKPSGIYYMTLFVNNSKYSIQLLAK